MKKLYLLLCVLFLISFGFGQNKVNINNLVKYGDKMFKENDDKPYTGLVFDLSKSTGNKILEGRYKNGLKDGMFIEWNENQEIIKKGMFKSNLMDSEWFFLTKQSSVGFDNIVSYYDKGDGGNPDEFSDELNRDLFSEFDNYEFIRYLMNIGIPINGLTKTIFNREDEHLEINFKNGYFNGFIKQVLNGWKKYEGDWTDGKRNGLSTEWYKNGQKKSVETYKDGELISSKEWNEDGSVKE